MRCNHHKGVLDFPHFESIMFFGTECKTRMVLPIINKIGIMILVLELLDLLFNKVWLQWYSIIIGCDNYHTQLHNYREIAWNQTGIAWNQTGIAWNQFGLCAPVTSYLYWISLQLLINLLIKFLFLSPCN